jgi:hypothetical protein
MYLVQILDQTYKNIDQILLIFETRVVFVFIIVIIVVVIDILRFYDILLWWFECDYGRIKCKKNIERR